MVVKRKDSPAEKALLRAASGGREFTTSRKGRAARRRAM